MQTAQGNKRNEDLEKLLNYFNSIKKARNSVLFLM